MVDDSTNLDRRSVLKGLGTAGIVGLTGCLSDEVDGEVRLGHAGEDSASGPPALALQRIANQETEELTVTPQTVGGDAEGWRLVADQELDGNMGHSFSWLQGYDGVGPFEENPVEPSDLPSQLFSESLFQMYWVAREDTDIYTTDDLLNSDANVWLLDPDWGIHSLWRQILSHVEIDGETLFEHLEDRWVPADSSDAPGAIEEGQIDALVVNTQSYRALPGYTQEKDARGDFRALETTGPILEAMEAEPAVVVEEVEPFGWEQDLGRETVTIATLPAAVWVHYDQVSSEEAYELTRLAHEHGDEIYDSSPTSLDLSDVENMSILVEDAPVHPGAAEYFEEQGVWQDEWTATDEWEWP